MTKTYIGSDVWEVCLNSGRCLKLTEDELKEIADDSPTVTQQIKTMQGHIEEYEKEAVAHLTTIDRLTKKNEQKDIKIDDLQDQLDIYTNFGRHGK